MFLAATVLMCMSFNGMPSPPWAKCEVVEAPLVQAGQSTEAFGSQCRLALAGNLKRWIAAHPTPQWWVVNVNCAPVMPRSMG
jgi:hypothetical protein